MGFWTTAQTGNDPKRNYRFTVQITGLTKNNGDLWMAKSCAKPAYTINATPHQYLNHTFQFPGKVELQAISMVLVDPGGDNDFAKDINTLVQTAGYEIPGAGTLTTIGKKKLSSTIGSVVIKQLDADGSTVEKWTLMQPILTSVKFGDLAYDNENLTEVTLEWRYDWAEFEAADSEAMFKLGSSSA